MVRTCCWLAFVGGALGLAAGCTMCPQSPEDYTYAAYGGLLQRADMMHGRVGSAFAPAEAVPGHATPLGAPFEAPAAAAPPYAANAATANVAYSSHRAAKAFDPGDILSEAK